MNIGDLLLVPWQAEQRVLGVQAKLHPWAVRDDGRRFDDLFNLVVDPAFLALAWERVRENKGAKTAGIDGATRWSVENSARSVAGFLEELRVSVRNVRVLLDPAGHPLLSLPRRRLIARPLIGYTGGRLPTLPSDGSGARATGKPSSKCAVMTCTRDQSGMSSSWRDACGIC